MRYRHGRILLAVLIAVAVLPSVVAAQPDVRGQWTSLTALPFFPVHAHVLPTGKVMIWPGDDGISGNDPRLWDPATQAVTPLAKPGYDLFCTGHTFLADGRLFVAGGHLENNVGLAKASIYNPLTNTWTPLPDMNAGRWYPTVTPLPNGDALVVSGNVDLTVGINTLPQVYQAATGTWRDLTNAVLGFEYYPLMLLAPDGRVFLAGPSIATRLFDTSGSGTWTFVGHRNGPFRDYGSAVMYADGKVVTMGGSDPPSNTAEVIDLNQPSLTWRFTAPMQFARRQLNALILPDGKVLVTGGTSGPGFNDTTNPVFAAELWDPATEQWTTLASATVPRLYHSTTVLLPDGRVLSMGGNDHLETEVFSPPYLFKGARPVITSAPGSVGYGQSFFVSTADAASVAKVTMIRLSSTTHSFNMGQRFSQLTFSQATGGLNVTAPANGNLAPPGHYLLFILNGNGVPSVASIVKVGAAAAGPTLTSLSPNTATAGGPAFTLTVNGTNFVSGATVRWNGSNRTTTFASATRLTAAILNTDIATAGTPSVTVVNPGGATSNALTFTVTGPAPTLTSLSPNTATAGGPAFTLTVNGTNFRSGAVVRWNGANRTTTFASATQLTASILSADVAATGTPQVTVVNSDGTTSNALTFTVTGAAPTLTSLSPNTATAGGPAFTLTVNGTNFRSGAVVRWNGANRTTTFASATQLTASILSADVAATGTPQVTVVNSDGTTSNAVTFTVTGAAPTLTSLTPNTGTAAGPGFTLTANGTNFGSGAVVRWNGANRTTTFASPTQLTASILSTDIAAAGTPQVTVVNPDGATSNALTFTVTAAAPTLTSLSPNSATVGGAGFTLTVNGTNFMSGSIVRWNGANRPTTFGSATQVTASIPATDISASGTPQVTVVNSDGRASNALTFTVGDAPQPPATSSIAITEFRFLGNIRDRVGQGTLALAPDGQPDGCFAIGLSGRGSIVGMVLSNQFLDSRDWIPASWDTGLTNAWVLGVSADLDAPLMNGSTTGSILLPVDGPVTVAIFASDYDGYLFTGDPGIAYVLTVIMSDGTRISSAPVRMVP